ncbi:hypothetical protein Tco_0311422 [Tanacetum coccineum]
MINYIKANENLAAGSSQATITDSAKVGSSKRAAEVELDHEGSKRQKTNEASGSVQKQPDEEKKELSQEDLQQMIMFHLLYRAALGSLLMVVPVEEVYVEALQVKYPIIDWEVYTKESRKYWKIIRVGNHTKSYQFFCGYVKIFDRMTWCCYGICPDGIQLWSRRRHGIESSRSDMSQLRPDAVVNFLTPSLDRTRRRRFMPTTPSPRSFPNWLVLLIMMTCDLGNGDVPAYDDAFNYFLSVCDRNVISDEDLSSDEEIVLMGDVNFSNTDDDSDTSSAKEQPQVHQLQPLRRYRKIYTTGCVLFLRALNALVDQFVKKPIKSKVKLTNCILALRAPNTLEVGSSSQKRKSNLDISIFCLFNDPLMNMFACFAGLGNEVKLESSILVVKRSNRLMG